jgi:heat shock protein HslJ
MTPYAAAVISVVVMAAISGCAPSVTSSAHDRDLAHTARNSLDWAGAYRGVLPCADCPGIDTVVMLASDGTYSAQSKYLDKGSEVFSEHGTLIWNSEGNTISLEGREPAKYFVGENRLTRLALDGSRITGPNAGSYLLTRLPGGLAGPHWKLVELRGQPVPTLDREPYLMFAADGMRVSGFGGCNSFTGSYRLDEPASRIRFEQIASTMMACVGGNDVERSFHEVLETADNYSLNGYRLTLNRARMAPLARFEAVYLR